MRGPVALISAGWRHDEARDEPLREAVGIPVKNLGLYQAFRELEREAPDLLAAYARKQGELRRTKERYRLALVAALAACREIYTRTHDPSCPWFKLSIANLQAVDDLFVDDADRIHATFAQQVRPSEHPLVRRAIDRIRLAASDCSILLIAGGHVGVLRNRLEFLGAGDWLAGRRVVAWSGGAMVLTERVVLFHDYTTHGVGLAEVLDRGLGLVPDVVFLPHARQRLDLANAENVAILARRFAPRITLGLQNGGVLNGHPLRSRGVADGVLWLDADGSVRPLADVQPEGGHATAP